MPLTHWGWVMHICVNQQYVCVFNALAPCQHQTIIWLSMYSCTIDWTDKKTFHWNLNQWMNSFIKEIVFKNVVCWMLAILSRLQWVKFYTHPQTIFLAWKKPWFFSFPNCGNPDIEHRSSASLLNHQDILFLLIPGWYCMYIIDSIRNPIVQIWQSYSHVILTRRIPLLLLDVRNTVLSFKCEVWWVSMGC